VNLPEFVRLVDGEDRARKSSTWQMPARALRERLRVGEIVKVCFEYKRPLDPVEDERLWVVIEAVRDGFAPRFYGSLDNVPVLIPMDHGDAVEFGPEHVIDIAPRGRHTRGRADGPEEVPA
jgi:hypothetical protein